MKNKNNNPNGKGGAKAGEPSRNPKGRPKLDKSLTNLLRVCGNKRVGPKDSKKVSSNELLAGMLWVAVFTGYLLTTDCDINPGPEGSEEKISVKDRLSLAQWIFNRIDGMPRQALEVSQSPTEVIITADEMAAAVKELQEFTSED